MTEGAERATTGEYGAARRVLCDTGREHHAMSRRFSAVLGVFVLGLLVVATGVGQARVQQSDNRAAPVDVERLGPKVHDALPAFSLPDQHGQVRSLTSLLGSNGAVIVFFRSADW
jgi:hypothetical protein